MDVYVPMEETASLLSSNYLISLQVNEQVTVTVVLLLLHT